MDGKIYVLGLLAANNQLACELGELACELGEFSDIGNNVKRIETYP